MSDDSSDTATALGSVFGAIVVAASIVFFSVLLSTFLGGVAGWIIGLVFADPILNIIGQLGIHGVSMFQFGLFMGFVGGFLRTKVSK